MTANNNMKQLKYIWIVFHIKGILTDLLIFYALTTWKSLIKWAFWHVFNWLPAVNASVYYCIPLCHLKQKHISIPKLNLFPGGCIQMNFMAKLQKYCCLSLGSVDNFLKVPNLSIRLVVSYPIIN